MFRQIHLACMLLLLPTLALAGVINAPVVHLGSFNISTPHESECKWSILVRADDLRVGELSHGDARLINNMTNINNTAECEIARWSLVLRSQENAAMRYPMPLIELPKEPTYNYTWDTYRYHTSDFLDGVSSLNDESGSFIFDPYKKEREDYDRKLEEYARAIRTKDHFVVQRIEKIHFEISLDMGEVEKPIEDYQMTPLEPFAVSLPSSMEGPYNFQTDGYLSLNDRDHEQRANLTYRHDTQLMYIAKLTLRNGTEVELRAGDASFIPSKPEVSSPLPNRIKVDETKGTAWPVNQRDVIVIGEEEENKDKILFPGLDATISFDQVSKLKQGDQILLNGMLTATNSSYEIVSIAVKLENRVEPRWALGILESDKRPEVYEELKKRAEYQNDDGPRWFFNDDRASVSVTVPQTAVAIFEKERRRVENNEHDARCDASCSYSCSGTLGSDLKNAGVINKDGSFSIWLKVSDTAAVSPMDTSISHITSRLSFVLGIRMREENEGEESASTQESSARVQAIREALSDWPKNRHAMFKRCPKDFDKVNKKKESATFFLKQPIGEVSISPKEWKKYDRNTEVRDEGCTPPKVPTNELGPKLIRWNSVDEHSKDLHNQQACDSDASAFPKLSEISKTIFKSSLPSEDAKVEKINPLEFGHQLPNRWEACRLNFFDTRRRFKSPSTCTFNTGEVWAKKLLDQFKLQHSSNQKQYPANQNAESQPTLQFQ